MYPFALMTSSKLKKDFGKGPYEVVSFATLLIEGLAYMKQLCPRLALPFRLVTRLRVLLCPLFVIQMFSLVVNF